MNISLKEFKNIIKLLHGESEIEIYMDNTVYMLIKYKDYFTISCKDKEIKYNSIDDINLIIDNWDNINDIVIESIYSIKKDYNELYDFILLNNIELIHTTNMGIDRIKKNINKYDIDVVKYVKEKIKDSRANIYKSGKNIYCEIDDIIITINSYSFTIITVHKLFAHK